MSMRSLDQDARDFEGLDETFPDGADRLESVEMYDEPEHYPMRGPYLTPERERPVRQPRRSEDAA